MIVRLLAALSLLWLLGFAAFTLLLPDAADRRRTDGIVVLTGGAGRIERGLVHLEQGRARRMLVSGVNSTVRARELAAITGTSPRLFACCVDLGRESVDTRSNAEETAEWLRKNRFRTLRLVTTDWHMPRARFELQRRLGTAVIILPDGVESEPSFGTLFKEYNKYLLRQAAVAFGY